MGGNNQTPLLPASLEVGEGPDPLSRLLGVDDQDMTPFDPGLHPRNQEDAVSLCILPQLLRVGNPFMIGDGENLEAFLVGPIDQSFGTMRNGIVGIFAGVEMKISLQGRKGFYFPPPCFTQV